MLRKKKGNIEWLEFELLANEPNIAHGVFLRHGGVSQGTFASLNAVRGSGDQEKNIQENRSLIRKTLQLDKLISAWHAHAAHLEHVTSPREEFLECDGLMTAQKNWGLLAVHSDCQAALFYDPICKAVASVHAGWRGQAQNIYQKAITKMSQVFGSKPQDLLACISPSLGPQNAEFINYRLELPEEFWQFQIKPTYFDLWAIAQHQLEACGILRHHIEIAKIDTYAHPEDFFSYRREKAKGRKEKITGGHGTVIALLDRI